jgi:hypothetical protein
MRSPKKEAVGEWRYACRLPQMRSLKEGAVWCLKEQWSHKWWPLLGNSLVNMYPWKRTHQNNRRTVKCILHMASYQILNV